MGLQDEYRALLDLIRDAFRETVYPGDENILEFPLGDPEIVTESTLVYRALRGKKWQDIGLQLLADMWEIPGWMSPIAFRYYLPAFLIASAEDLAEDGSSLVPGIVWSNLTPPPLGIDPSPEGFRAQYCELTEQQVDAVRAYIHFIVTHFRWERGDRDERALIRRFWWEEQAWWEEQVRMGDLSSFNKSPALNSLDAQEYPEQPPDAALLGEPTRSEVDQTSAAATDSTVGDLGIPEDRRFRVRLLASNGAGRRAEVVAPLLEDDDRLTRDFAAIAMAKAKDLRALAPLIIILLDGNREAVIRWMAADALGALGDVQALVPLKQVLKDPEEDDTVRARSAEALANINDRSVVQSLIDCLSDPKPEVVYSCALALGIIGDPVALPALQGLADRNSVGAHPGPVAGIAQDAIAAFHSRSLR